MSLFLPTRIRISVSDCHYYCPCKLLDGGRERERALSGQAQRCRSSAAYAAAAAAAAAVAAAAAMRRGIHYVFSASVRKRSRGIFDSCPKGA